MISIGHSHLACVLVAARDRAEPFAAIMLTDDLLGEHFAGIDDRALVLEPDGRRLSARGEEVLRRADGPVFSFVGGIKHVSLGLRRHPQPFDFVLPEAPELPLEEGAEVVPDGALRESLTRRSQGYLEIVTRVAELAPGPVYQFEPPPPPPDSWLVERLAAKQRGRAQPGSELPGRFVRYKLWRLNSSIVRDHADAHGVQFVSCPSGTVDEEGFLLPEYVRNATHAGPTYGARVLEQIDALR